MNLKKEQSRIFEILKIYSENISFETSNILQISQENLEHKIGVNLKVNTKDLENHMYKVTLNVVITNRNEDKIIFLIEITQVGIFLIKYFPMEEMKNILNIKCSHLLFSSVCEIVTALTTYGGFKPLHLNTVEFK